MEKTKKTHKSVYITLIFLAIISVVTITAIAFFNYFSYKDKFYKNTKINGIDVGGLNVIDASNVVETNFNSSYRDIKINLVYKDKDWEYTSKDFEIIDNFDSIVQQTYNKIVPSNFFERHFIKKELKKNNGNVNVSYRSLLGGFDEILNNVCLEINQDLKEPSVFFDPSSDKNFEYIEGQNQVIVNRTKLEELIDNSFASSRQITVYVPYDEIEPSLTIDDLKNKTQLRASFSTNYSKSTNNRKSNVKTALNAFNGQILEPQQEMSFNTVTGARTKENGYKPANIILNGVYVEGSGGGVCQASTTLYNALLLANLEILEVNKHSLPASYVPLAFDAMVSEGVSDLVFKNNTNEPIYIKTWGDNTDVYVQIFGLPFENGEYYKTRAEFIKAIPHPGDRIVSDNGEYSNKVTFKGEYLRLKYPQEGYEANAYLQRYSKDGVLLEEKLIRHEIYKPQEGIIIEGTEEVYEGVTIPENNVKFIPPQASSNTSEENVKNKINGTNGEKYNP